jgi:FeS assembly protein IscX
MHWNNIEEIATHLEETYAEDEIPENNLLDLKEMILSLPNFEDHEVEVTNFTLNQIIESWIYARNGN